MAKFYKSTVKFIPSDKVAAGDAIYFVTDEHYKWIKEKEAHVGMVTEDVKLWSPDPAFKDISDDLNDDEPAFDDEDINMPEISENKTKIKTTKMSTFKADKMTNGFMFQSNALAEDKEPFYMEAYLLGLNEFYISGGLSGTLNVSEMKQLRKQLKFLLNQMEESYPEVKKKNKDDDGEPKKSKVVLKVDAPWIPNAEQLDTVKLMVSKELAKLEGETTEEVDTLDVLAGVVKTVLSQLTYEKHTGDTTGE